MTENEIIDRLKKFRQYEYAKIRKMIGALAYMVDMIRHYHEKEELSDIWVYADMIEHRALMIKASVDLIDKLNEMLAKLEKGKGQ
ncbi:MAG: hypothetical protein DRJ46_04905 [Thermoprotei archaeon]|nr:MAG: hypothetical protein DRJ46_04905 [Thermoprotei archaeon]